MTRVAAIVALAGALLLNAAPADGATRLVRGNDGPWLAYGHDDQLSNAVVSRILDAQTVPRLGERWAAPLDELVAASPLYAEPLVDGVRTGVVYVGTEGGSVYALAAGDGHVLWERSGAPTVIGACGEFPFGISSTGAIDRGRNVLYSVGADGLLHAFDLATGADAPGYPVQVVASPFDQYVWGGLRIVGSTLYVPVSSFCDQLDASGLFPDGGLVAVDLADPSQQRFFDAVPGVGNGGGIWGYGGVSVEPGGHVLYAGVGNSHVYDASCACFRDDVPNGDRMVALTPDLQVVDADYPPGINPEGDQDFGAAPSLFQPHGCPPLAAANSKDGLLYVWRRANLAAGPLKSLGIGDGQSAFVGQPSWSSRLQMLFDGEAGSDSGNGVAAIKFSYRGCEFGELWRTAIGAGNQAPPLVVNDVVFSGGGNEGLFALDARTGKVIWSAGTDGAKTLAPLIEARGTVFAPAGSELRAYSLP
jgi:outer membrane protein assembly factor BamB